MSDDLKKYLERRKAAFESAEANAKAASEAKVREERERREKALEKARAQIKVAHEAAEKLKAGISGTGVLEITGRHPGPGGQDRITLDMSDKGRSVGYEIEARAGLMIIRKRRDRSVFTDVPSNFGVSKPEDVNEELITRIVTDMIDELYPAPPSA
jgi:hypothetical protein